MDNDGLQLTGRIVAVRYADVYCGRCGALTGSTLSTCKACLAKQYLVEMLARQREILTEHRPEALRFRVARDRGAALHLVLFGDGVRTAWCGTRVISEKKSKKVYLAPEKFPAALCPACVEAYQKMAREVAARELELEHICEACHERPAAVIFDRRQVCAPCHARLEARLLKEGSCS